MKVWIALALLLCGAAFAAPHSALATEVTKQGPTTNGLVGYWKFDDASGTVAADSSGNSKKLTCTSTGWSRGKLGSASVFAGNSASVCVRSSASDFQVPGDVTVSAWIFATSTGSGQEIVRKGQLTDEQYGLLYNGSIKSIGFQQYNGTAFEGPGSLAGSVPLNTWVQVTAVRSGTTVTMYVNGTSNASGTVGTPATPTSGLSIGSNSVTGGQNFAGSLDDVRIYNRALSAAEVQALYKAGEVDLKQGPTNGGLVGYWKFDEGVGTKATDSSGIIGDTLGCTSFIWTPGKLGGAIQLNGNTTSWCQPASNNRPSLSLTGNMTTSVWMYSTSTSAIQGVIRNGQGTDEQYSIYYDGGNQRIGFGWYDGSAFQGLASTVGSVPRNQWILVTVTRTGSALAFYANGVPVGTATFTSAPNTPSIFTIGGTNSGSQAFVGKLDDVRLYNRALSAAEVQALYKAGETKAQTSSAPLTNGSTLQSGLTGLWTFDGNDFSIPQGILDKSGNGNSGYFIGGATSSAITIGKMGQALKFNSASSQKVSLSNLPTSGTSNFSIFAWVNSSTVGTRKGIVAYGSNTTDTGVNLFINPSNQVESDLSADPGPSSTATVTDGKWHLVGVTNAGGTMQVYVDGVASGSSRAKTPNIVSRPNFNLIGEDFFPAYFNGSIDDVRVYSRALSASEIKQLYNLGK